MKYSNKVRFGINIIHLDNNTNKLYLNKYNDKNGIITWQ